MTWVITVLVSVVVIATVTAVFVIRITKKECPEGRFGKNCKEVCYRGFVENGKCICFAGWKAPNCRERDCPDGYYDEDCKLKCVNGRIEDDSCVCNEGFEGEKCSNKLLTDDEALPLIKELVDVRDDVPSQFRTNGCDVKTTQNSDGKYKTYGNFYPVFLIGDQFALIDDREVKNIILHSLINNDEKGNFFLYTLVSSKKIPDDFMPGICLMSNAFPIKK